MTEERSKISEVTSLAVTGGGALVKKVECQRYKGKELIKINFIYCNVESKSSTQNFRVVDLLRNKYIGTSIQK